MDRAPPNHAAEEGRHGAPVHLDLPDHSVFILYRSALFCDLLGKLLAEFSTIRVSGATDCVDQAIGAIHASGSRTVLVEGAAERPADRALFEYVLASLEDVDDLHLLMLDLGGRGVASWYMQQSSELTGEDLRVLVMSRQVTGENHGG